MQIGIGCSPRRWATFVCFTAALAALQSPGTTADAAQPGAKLTRQDVASTFAVGAEADHDPAEKSADTGADQGAGPSGEPADTPQPDTGAIAGGPPNDFCSNATIIPGDVINYNPPQLNTTTALASLCEPLESCESGTQSTGRTVYYRYTPVWSGTARINTFGSNYDTVLSVFDACATSCGLGCCNQPNEIACNDNASFGSQSELFIDVVAGTTYYIKVGTPGFSSPGGLLDFDLSWIPGNNLCSNAKLIPSVLYEDGPYPTDNADTDLCEANENCELNNVGVSNSVFYSYTPPCDGLLSINTNDSDYDTVLSVWDGCGQFQGIDNPCLLPAQIACDDDAGIGLSSQIVDLPVVGGQEYIIKVADYNTTSGGGDLVFRMMFDGGDVPDVAITSPGSFDCVCGNVPVEGTVTVPGDGLLEWALEFAPVNGGSWQLIASDVVAVQDGLLALWNTGGLPTGYYFLRLTAESGCSLANTATAVVYVDNQFDSLELRSPREGYYAGTVCADGTAWDRCFDHYTVDYAPSGATSFQPVDPAMPQYDQPVTNDPLASWDSTTVPDGEYAFRLRGTDSCGFTAEETVIIAVDNTLPVAQIVEPLSCACVDGLVDIVGTASDANLDQWVLQYAGEGDGQWHTLTSSQASISSDVLYTWDTSTLAPCTYALRLLVYDRSFVNCTSRRFTEFVTTLEVGCDGTYDFDADDDGDVDLADFGVFESEFTGP